MRSRDLWIVLRARDEASRIFRNFSNSLGRQSRAVSEFSTNITRNFDSAGRLISGTYSEISKGANSTYESFARVGRGGEILGSTFREVRKVGNHNVETIKELDKNFNVVSETINKTENKTQRMRISADQLSMSLEAVARVAMMAGTALVAVGGSGLAFTRSNIEVAAEYDRQARRTLTQIEDISVTLEDVAQVGRNVAREVGVPFESLQDTLFFIFSSMDVNITEAQDLLEGFSRAAVAGATDVESAAHSTIAIMNALAIPVENLTDVQDVQFQIVRRGIISYEELSATIGRALPATARAGQNFETLGAMMAFMTRNGLSAAMSATSAARALESFAHPTVVQRLEGMGIAVRDIDGEFRPLLDVMADMNQHMADMSQPERTAFLQELFTGAGGTIQARRFWDLAFNNFSEFEEMVGSMEGASGAFGEAYGEMSGSVAAQTELMRNKWMLIKEALGRAVMPTFLQILGVLGALLDWFDRLPEPVKNIIAQFILWGSVIAIVVGGIILVIGILAFFVAGLILAWKAILIITAVMTVVIGVITALAAAFVLAWNKSDRFRALVASVVDTLKQFWNIAVEVGKGVAAAFQEHIVPAMESLWNTIENDVMPVVLDLWEHFKSKIIPVVERLAEKLVSGLADGFEFVRNAIEDHLVPALEKLHRWYEENREGIHSFLDALVAFIEFIGGVAVRMIVGFVAIIGIIIIVAAKIIEIFITVQNAINAVVDFIMGLPAFFRGIWNSIVSALTTAWNAVAEFFTNIWNFIVGIFTTALNFIVETMRSWGDFLINTFWVPFWNTFGGIFTAAWELLLAFLNFFVVLFTEIWNDWLVPLGGFFANVWNAIVEIAKTVWEAIVTAFTVSLEFIKNLWNTVWGAVSSFFVDLWDNIVGFLSGAWEAITSMISESLDTIAYIWDLAWEDVKDVVRSVWDAIDRLIGDKIRAVKDAFVGAKDWLVQAGKDIIQGLLDGIESMIGRITDTLNGITDRIPDWKGPAIVDQRILRPAGQDVMRGFLNGIRDQLPAVMRTLQGITTDIGGLQPALATPTGPMVRSAEDQPAKVINQHITVNTQEIDPVRHAEQIGWLLQTRT